MDLPGIIASRAARAGLAAAFCVASNGCASLKQMTSDFNRKWDDPKAAIAELDESADGVRASSSSSDEMASMNANDCARQFGLNDKKADEATLGARRRPESALRADGRRDIVARVDAHIPQDGRSLGRALRSAPYGPGSCGQ